MCDYISWLEVGDDVVFLTADDIFRSKEGKKMQKFNPVKEDWVGHGAIRHFYGIKSGVGIERECTNFSTPHNFPTKIVAAIKSGKMNLSSIIGWFPHGLLSDHLYADYQAKRAARNADYQAKCDALDADHQAKCDAMYADYQAKCDVMYADYRVKRDALDADHQAKCDAMYADYQAKRAALNAEMWKLFELPENRRNEWR